MFSKVKRLPIQFSGDWLKDRYALVRWILKYDEDLERQGALAFPEVDTWTPVLTFATAGDLSVTYSLQLGWKRNIGELTVADFSITTSAFTHTTAAGNLQITGLPVAAIADTNYFASGSVTFGGITKAGYTQVDPVITASSSTILFVASGSGVAAGSVVAADMPTGGSVRLRGTIVYAGAV